MRFFFFGLVLMASLSLVQTVAVADSTGDKAMAQNIADRFRSSGQMQKYHVGVKCDNGTAWLIGSVTDTAQQQTAIKIAQATPGVTRVMNKLIIENGRVARATLDQAQPRNQLRPQNQAGPRGLQQPQGMSVQVSMAEPIVSGPTFEISPPLADERFAPVFEDESFTPQPRIARRRNRPLALARRSGTMHAVGGQPLPAHAPIPSGVSPARFDQPQMPPLCVAELRCLSELCRTDLSETVFTDGLAFHRPVLSLSASAARLAQGHVRVGRWLVATRFQGIER